jgi:hypothetical protein
VNELPQSERGRRFFIHTLTKNLENFYDATRHRLHIDAFHEGIVIFDSLKDDLNKIGKFIADIKK